MAQAIVYTNGHGKLIEYDPINEEWPAGRSIDIGNVMDDFEISALRLKMYAIRVHLLLPLLESSCRFKRRDASALFLELIADALKEGEGNTKPLSTRSR